MQNHADLPKPRHAGGGPTSPPFSFVPLGPSACAAPPKPPISEGRPRFGYCAPLDSPESPREPILTIPFGMTAILVVMAGIHGVRALLPLATDQEVIWTFGFVPARYDASVLAGQFPGGVGAEIWTFLTYAFLHADTPTSPSTCCGCSRSAARSHAGSAPHGSSHSSP